MDTTCIGVQFSRLEELSGDMLACSPENSTDSMQAVALLSADALARCEAGESPFVARIAEWTMLSRSGVHTLASSDAPLWVALNTSISVNVALPKTFDSSRGISCLVLVRGDDLSSGTCTQRTVSQVKAVSGAQFDRAGPVSLLRGDTGPPKASALFAVGSQISPDGTAAQCDRFRVAQSAICNGTEMLVWSIGVPLDSVVNVAGLLARQYAEGGSAVETPGSTRQTLVA